MTTASDTPTGSGGGIGRGEVCVRLSHVEKSFSGVKVLDDINLEIRLGEIHGLVGENGAGKSTVGKIVGGYYSKSAGELEVFGETTASWTPAEALERGVAMMHQELQLVPALTVAENVFLGIEHNRSGVLARDEEARLAGIIAICGFDLDPSARADSLSIADQQKVEIMRAMAREARVIVMDEPTSSLTANETDRLHQTMRRLREAGRTVIYVSHFLDHVLEICDTVTVMRDGAIVRTADAAGETKTSLVSAMLGGGAGDIAFPERPPAPEPGAAPLLEVRDLNSPAGVHDVGFHVGRGEIVGLIGLVGSGRSEIARALFGADTQASGRVTVDGRPVEPLTVAQSVAMGVTMVPEDRRKQGLVLTQNVRENMSLPHLSAYSSLGVMNLARERSRVRHFIDYFAVTPRHVDGEVVHYSGGNQQKVLLGKWIMRDPKVVILDEPSRGVDVGARQRIHEFIVDLARGGAGVILISSEIEEVLGLAHRAYLVRDGRLGDEIVPEETSVDKVLWTLFHEEREAAAAAG